MSSRLSYGAGPGRLPEELGRIDPRMEADFSMISNPT
jgi:hypothetical protein